MFFNNIQAVLSSAERPARLDTPAQRMQTRSAGFPFFLCNTVQQTHVLTLAGNNGWREDGGGAAIIFSAAVLQFVGDLFKTLVLEGQIA